MSSLPNKGPVVIENNTKRRIVIRFVTGETPVTQDHRAHKFNQTCDEIILGSSLDFEVARVYERQAREHEAEIRRNPGTKPLDPRDAVHNPVLHIEAKQWECIKKTPETWAFLNGLAGKRDIRVSAA